MKLLLILFFVLPLHAKECETLLEGLLSSEHVELPFSDQEDPHPEGLFSAVGRVEDRAAISESELKRLEMIDLPYEGRPTVDQLTLVQDAVATHPVANVRCLMEYDPTGEIGFCFGRAFAVHIEAMKQNIDEQFIRKGFVIGQFKTPLNEGGEEWLYHMATLILSTDGWYALDTRLQKPLPVEDWIKVSSKYEIESTGFVYSIARRLTPSAHNYYDPAHFKTPQRDELQDRVARYLRAVAESYLKE